MKTKFVIGGVLILAAVSFLVVTAVQSAAQYSYTVEQVLDKQSELADSPLNLRVSGYVIGDSIQHDPTRLALAFDVVSTHEELAAPERILHVVADGHARPDLLQDQAQATMSGRLGADGVLYVAQGGDSLLLKCPTRYEEALPTAAP
ncbi:MAG: cytochrome c maturation protein CcmE [Thermoflexales bacterium]|nr:cytochrome c maturation protein CcmE [Thermoflexales bacterium]